MVYVIVFPHCLAECGVFHKVKVIVKPHIPTLSSDKPHIEEAQVERVEDGVDSKDAEHNQ